MTAEGDRWFSVERERQRERIKRLERAKRRAQRSTQREERMQRVFGNADDIRMQVTDWETDAQGNLSRKVFQKG
jgi:hypothetical protein